jgi:hypothetical protein
MHSGFGRHPANTYHPARQPCIRTAARPPGHPAPTIPPPKPCPRPPSLPAALQAPTPSAFQPPSLAAPQSPSSLPDIWSPTQPAPHSITPSVMLTPRDRSACHNAPPSSATAPMWPPPLHAQHLVQRSWRLMSLTGTAPMTRVLFEILLQELLRRCAVRMQGELHSMHARHFAGADA